MNSFISTKSKITGSNYKEVFKKATIIFDSIVRKSKRKPYIRSAYFLKQKIFINLFWVHLFDKSFLIRTLRLKYLTAGFELVEKSRIPPSSRDNPNNENEILHRFEGITRDKFQFFSDLESLLLRRLLHPVKFQQGFIY